MPRLVVFDWGDTLMRVFPAMDGPMALWPNVEAMPGAAAMLDQLSRHFSLAVATNVADSGATSVEAALHRVGLDRFLTLVLTPQELNARKPDKRFYLTALEKAGVAPDEAVYIGDSYVNDICGAKAAGMRAIWYHPYQPVCPEPEPAHDAAVTELADLFLTLQRPFLPDLSACEALHAASGVVGTLRSHCRAVAAVAFRLSERLLASGEPVDPLLAHRGGLVHDIGKPSAKRSGESHEIVGGRILRSAGYPTLAEIAERHTAWSVLDATARPTTLEQRLVYVADRLVEDDRLIGIDARVASMTRRRPELADRAPAIRSAAHQVFGEIAAGLGMTEGGLADWLSGQASEDELGTTQLLS